jgi:hypothetical protein
VQAEPRVKKLAHTQDTPEARKTQCSTHQAARSSADARLGLHEGNRHWPFLDRARPVTTAADAPLPHPSSNGAQPQQTNGSAPAAAPLSSRPDGMIMLEEPPATAAEAENAKLKAQLDQALSFNEMLWKGVVEGTLTLAPPKSQA